MGLTLNASFMKVVGLGGIVWASVWDTNKAIDIWEWSICGGGKLKRYITIRPDAVGESVVQDSRAERREFGFRSSQTKPNHMQN